MVELITNEWSWEQDTIAAWFGQDLAMLITSILLSCRALTYILRWGANGGEIMKVASIYNALLEKQITWEIASFIWAWKLETS